MVVPNMFYLYPYLAEDSHFDEHIFQMGWFNHQLSSVQGPPVGWVFFRDEILRRYIGIIISHEIRILINQPGVHGMSTGLVHQLVGL